MFVGFAPGWVGDSLVTTAELFVRKLEMKPWRKPILEWPKLYKTPTVRVTEESSAEKWVIQRDFEIAAL